MAGQQQAILNPRGRGAPEAGGPARVSCRTGEGGDRPGCPSGGGAVGQSFYAGAREVEIGRLTGARIRAALRLAGDSVKGIHLAARVGAYVRQPITREEALAVLRRRYEQRERTFLAIARRTIYGNRGSPYRRLLSLAGCQYGDLEQLVIREGVEGTLAVLFRRGVYLTVDEYKGRRPVVRSGRTIDVDPQRLRNPHARIDIFASTSGSRGARTVTGFDLAFVRDCAVNTCLFLGARGGADWVKADWEGPGGGAAFRLLKFNTFGAPVGAWFTRNRGESLKQPGALNAEFMRLGGWWGGVPFPRPVWVSHEDPQPIARWMHGILRSGRTPHLYGFVSSVVRLCQAAVEAGLDLHGAEFTLIGEPTTAARLATIRRSGANGLPRYGSIEAGPIGYGCINPEAPDDVHVQEDRVAVIQAGTGHTTGLPAQAMLLTSLNSTAPFIFLNVSMGDQARLVRRACGCPMEQLGHGVHLDTILSYEKLTAAGMTLLDADIVRVLEETLPARFGGVPSQYQLVEDEAEDGQPRLTLVVHPGVRAVDDQEIIRVFRSGLRATEGLWDTPGFLQVERRPPITTASGKILHLHLGRYRPVE